MEENVFTNARKIYVKKKIDCELYTNEHVSYSLIIPLEFNSLFKNIKLFNINFMINFRCCFLNFKLL
jgi:hypothetical protein